MFFYNFINHHSSRFAMTVLLLACMTSVTSAQGPVPQNRKRDESRATSPVVGKWSYRSFVSNPDLTAEPNSLLFGSGTMELSVTEPGTLSGTLGGEGWQLVLTGKLKSGDPTSIRFTGKGTIGGEEWVYDYVGYVVPGWPNGVDQRPAIVGSIVRTVPHSGGTATAGYVAQWIAVKQESTSPNNRENGPRSDATIAADAVAELGKVESRWAKAVATNDPAQIGKFFTEDFLFVGAGGILQDRQQHLEDFQSGRLKIESVEINEFIARAYNGFAVVNTLVSVKGKLGERDISGGYRFMDTFRKSGNQWLAVARQQTRTVINNAKARVEFKVESHNYRFLVDSVENPPLKVQQGSLVKVSLTSRQGSHDWVLTNDQGDILARTARVSAGQPAVTVEFTPNDLGEFIYYCSVGNHRVQGMEGKFVVEASPSMITELEHGKRLALSESPMQKGQLDSKALGNLIRYNPSTIHPPFGNLYSHGVEVPTGMRTLHIAGQAGVAKDGTVPDDPDSQLDLAWGNVKSVLMASGMTVDDLVKVNCYISDEKYTDAYARSVERHLGTFKPAMTAPVVRRLWSEKWHFEIDAVAAATEVASDAKVRMNGRPTEFQRNELRQLEQPERRDLLPDTYKQDLLKMYRDTYEDAPANNRQGVSTFRELPKAGLQPTTILSANGRLDVTLRVQYANKMIGTDSVRLRMYNDNLVGPTLRAKAGDTLFIKLINELPVESRSNHSSNGHHEWNTTNLHFHGLHVSPNGVPGAQSDNVFVSLKPVNQSDPSYPATESYVVKIPENHVAGTFWYHAHRHGAVAAQVSSGMAGALIIEREVQPGKIDRLNLNSIPEIHQASEEVLLLQQIPYIWSEATQLGTVELENAATMFGPGQWKNRLKRYVTVNGLKIPTLHVSPGEVKRLRIIHSGQREPVALAIETEDYTRAGDNLPSMYEVAVDGLPTGNIQPKPVLELWPGYRSDVLLKVPHTASGVYYLVDRNAPSGVGERGAQEPLKWVVKIEVSGNSVSYPWPTAESLAQVNMGDLRGLPKNQETQHAYYGIRLPSLKFLISRRNLAGSNLPVDPTNEHDNDFGESKPPRLVQLNTIDSWQVGSRNYDDTDQTTPPIVHPFHIHTNPFQIVRVTNVAGEDVTESEIGYPSLWRDTLALKQGLTYDLLTHYEEFAGSFVNHCHILDHEDNGMMEKVTIQSPSSPTPRRSPLSLTGDSIKTRILKQLPKPDGKPSVLLFVQGAFCPHCLNQVTEMARHLPESRCRICVISASSTEDLKRFPNLPYSLVADPDKKLFERFALEGNTHGTIVLDRTGKEKFRRAGSEPFMDLAAISGALTESVASVVIEVRETSEVTDDYITWAPTLCRARVVGGNPTEPSITVVLTNDHPASIPTGGDVRFATSLTPKETATALTQRLSLPQDGTAVSFYIAGAFGKPSTLTESSLAQGGRDAVIVVHRDSETGPILGEHAVMVRVRKAMRRQDSTEPKLNDLELVELLKAMRALHFDHNRYEQYVFVHRLATGESVVPDQAHLGPAFVAWHRAFLLQFERDLQAIAPHVSLPYWLQRERQDFYRSSRFGTNNGGTRVVFDRYSPSASTGSPLYGWTISLAHASPVHTGPMGPLERQNSDHNNPPSSATYQAWGPRLEGLTAFRDAFPNFWFQVEGGENQANPNFNVERNPHNNGHVNVGPNRAWMEICTESNADPVFWVFHCNHDYLWAKWQHYHNRFLTARGNPDHYWPSDAFTESTADRRTPRGHHLLDPMWPWDQSSSVEYPGERPNQHFPAFPASVVRGLWPATTAHPAPADVIDYQGIGDRGRDLGFCYDDVPWGHRSISTPEPVFEPLAADDRAEAALFLSERVSTDQRLLAFHNGDRQGSSITVEKLSAVIISPKENVDIRRRSLQMLSGRANSEAIDVASKVLADAESPLSLRIESLATINSLSHFSPLKHAQHMELQRQASSLLERSGTPAALRRQLLYTLAPSGDARAEEAIVSCLERPEESPLTVPEAIRLLRFYPKQFDHVRKKLMSPNDESAVAAIEVLNHDKESLGVRITIAVDKQRAEPVRNSALQSLMHDHSADAIDALLLVFSAGESAVELRSEAIAAARVNLELGRGFASKEQLVAWEKIVRNVETADASDTELGSLKTDFLNQLSREAK